MAITLGKKGFVPTESTTKGGYGLKIQTDSKYRKSELALQKVDKKIKD